MASPNESIPALYVSQTGATRGPGSLKKIGGRMANYGGDDTLSTRNSGSGTERARERRKNSHGWTGWAGQRRKNGNQNHRSADLNLKSHITGLFVPFRPDLDIESEKYYTDVQYSCDFWETLTWMDRIVRIKAQILDLAYSCFLPIVRGGTCDGVI